MVTVKEMKSVDQEKKGKIPFIDNENLDIVKKYEHSEMVVYSFTKGGHCPNCFSKLKEDIFDNWICSLCQSRFHMGLPKQNTWKQIPKKKTISYHHVPEEVIEKLPDGTPLIPVNSVARIAVHEDGTTGTILGKYEFDNTIEFTFERWSWIFCKLYFYVKRKKSFWWHKFKGLKEDISNQVGIPVNHLFGKNTNGTDIYLCAEIDKYEEQKKGQIHDNINHPNHYNTGIYEVIDVIEDWKLNFNLGNAVKYIARCEHKDHKKTDIKKAIWYLNRELMRYE